MTRNEERGTEKEGDGNNENYPTKDPSDISLE